MPSSKFGKLVPHGVYAPLTTFYSSNTSQDLDLSTYAEHVKFVASSGVGIVCLGSMGEAVQLSHSERNLVVEAARKALDSDEKLKEIPLIVGTGASSTRETIELTKSAAEKGADFGMVIAPGYFSGALSKEALKTYFVEVAEASPIPVILYNYPGVTGGIDMDSDLITDIAASCSNIVGIKLTCGSVGKLTRLTTLRPDFAVLGGFVDFLGPSLLASAAGGITGTANIAPKTCLKLYNLTKSGLSGNSSDLSEAIKLQSIVSHADWALQKVGISGTKYALEQLKGYGGIPRKPILEFKGDKEGLMESLKEILEVEKGL
ncbi:dihydrodipicolinate synthase family protein [Sporobolomyces salmoneus]|uniref:dihydrodipicolinate synthase family protein n=1 Tax=Sporobolomyces salmoneus TaxID=183962 RepID=UPI00317DDC6E